MDSLLLIGSFESKLEAFFQKVGYKLFHDSDPGGIASIIGREVIDLVLIDASKDRDGHELAEFFRKNDTTRETPLLVLCPDRLQALQIKELPFEKIECLQAPYSLGTVVSKVATQIRLRKMTGKNAESASLSEVNASLRDLNARFMKEIEEAQTIQKALLPKELPVGEEFEVGATYLPFEEVGGDWYHIGRTASGKILMLIADVTGHGLPAAFIGCMTKLALVASQREIPSELLHEMNRLMAPIIPGGRFVTGNAFLFDPETGTLECARAGGAAAHLLKRSSQRTVEITGDGFPIGFFEDGEYARVIETMDKGDVLLVTTDGVTEARNRKNEFFGNGGLSAALKETKESDSAADILAAIQRSFTDFCDGRIVKDDVTMLVLKRR